MLKQMLGWLDGQVDGCDFGKAEGFIKFDEIALELLSELFDCELGWLDGQIDGCDFGEIEGVANVIGLLNESIVGIEVGPIVGFLEAL